MKISRRNFLKIAAMSAAGHTMNTFGPLGFSLFPDAIASNGMRPNIIMIAVDTLRADHTSISGYPRQTTPNLDKFSQQACVFQNTISSAPWTLPSYASILMSKHAFNHNQNMSIPIPELHEPPNHTMLPKLLRYKGYRTVSIQTNIFLQYLHYDFEDRAMCIDESCPLDETAINSAISWLNDDDNIKDPFFMFVGLMSPHAAYKPDSGYLEEFVMDDLYLSQKTVICPPAVNQISYDDLSPELQTILGRPVDPIAPYEDSGLYIAAYDGEIKYADYQISRLFDELKRKNLFNNAIIIVTADHGENMIDHESYFSHGDSLLNSLIHVPLLIKFPTQTDQLTFNKPVRSIDILPTVFDYLSLDTGDVDGQSLLPVVTEANVDYFNRPVISFRVKENAECGEDVRDFSVIADNYKLIKASNGDELYYLPADPFEQNNIADYYPEKVWALNSYLSLFTEL